LIPDITIENIARLSETEKTALYNILRHERVLSEIRQFCRENNRFNLSDEELELAARIYIAKYDHVSGTDLKNLIFRDIITKKNWRT
jgi:hypothetical protein